MQSWNFIVCNCCVRADYVSGNGFRDDVSGIFYCNAVDVDCL